MCKVIFTSKWEDINHVNRCVASQAAAESLTCSYTLRSAVLHGQSRACNHIASIMLSRLLDKALVKLDVKDSAHQTSAKADERLYSTYSFPPPPRGTNSLCARCLTILSHFITHFGDGIDYQPLVITHSSAIRDLSHAVQMNHSIARKKTTECVICIKVFILFKAMQAHISFEDAWRKSPSVDWSLTWGASVQSYEANQDRLHVKFSVTHKGGYGWGIGM